MKPMLKAPGAKRLKLKYDEPPSNFAFNFNLRRYSLGLCTKRLSGCAVPKEGELEGAQGDGHNRNAEVARCRLTPC